MTACCRVSKGLEVLCEVPVLMNLSLPLSRNNMCVYLFKTCLGPCTKLGISGSCHAVAKAALECRVIPLRQQLLQGCS